MIDSIIMGLEIFIKVTLFGFGCVTMGYILTIYAELLDKAMKYINKKWFK